MNLELNKEYKLFAVSDLLACTTARIFKVVGYNDGREIIVYKNNSGRYQHKKYYLSQDKDIIILPLDQCTLKADSETGNFMGNACFNFRNSEQEITEQLKKNLVDGFLNRWKINRVEGDNYTEVAF